MSWAHRKLNQAHWKNARRAALRRAGFRCEGCGRPGRLEVHHVKPLEDGGAPFEHRNLRVLCFPCHRDAHQADRAVEVAGRSEWIRELRNAFTR